MRVKVGLIALLAVAASAVAQSPSVPGGIKAWSKGDFAGAVGAWRPLATQGDADAMFNLGQAYRLGKGVPIDLGQAMRWYTAAANAGHVDAQTQLGILQFENGNQLSGLRWLKQAADAGEPRAQLLYGTALFNGDGLIRRDPATAYSYVARAAAQGLAPARTTLAEMEKAVPLNVRRRAVAGATVKSPKPAPTTSRSLAAPVAPRAPASSQGGWRVQLGAFGQPATAQALFRKLAAGPLAGKQAFLVPAGAVTRLQAGPYGSQSAASAACSALAARGQACFAVAAQ